MDQALSAQVTRLVQLIDSAIEKKPEGYDEFDGDVFAEYKSATVDSLALDNSQFKFNTSEELEDEEVKKFNEVVSAKIKESVLNTSFQKVLLALLDQYVDNRDTPLVNTIAFVLDYLLWLAIEVDKTAKTTFYYCLEVASNHLFSISTSLVESLWLLVEARLPIIQARLFENSFSERIAILSLGNSLTNKYDTSTTGWQADTTLKDTFNDRFQSRVRIFMNALLAIDDNTGLNKYFHIHNATPPSIETKDVFISDVLSIQKMFNNPLFYLKKSSVLEHSKLTEKLYRVYGQLVEEESRFREKNPLPDQFSFTGSKSESEREYLRSKYLRRVFVPESYLESNFEKGPKSDETQNADYKFIYHQLELSKVRVQYLLMIYILAVLYTALTPTNKSEFMKSIGAPVTTKHITEDLPVISTVKIYQEIKKDLPSLLKKIDPSLPFLFLHLSIDEKVWWKWLLHGKDDKNQGFFTDKLLQPQELDTREDEFKKLYPYKNKRSFNTYVTPQVSKKMRTERGLTKLEQTAKYDAEKAALELEEIETELEKEENEDLKNKRSAYAWKLLRWKRKAET
ncbi:hypothetical protein KGF57_003806 [Candida theae]|uniref:Uncharacterized protein n=1 Tax=Candida theae TaxID=1198502 RepID=A0AAD5BCT8_9ASCO|nr:uncharacterized protein KGF57_003806 [Candida theae]KAI5954783.1 hypothetical protein KGF57_003806 [Candida theae]